MALGAFGGKAAGGLAASVFGALYSVHRDMAPVIGCIRTRGRIDSRV